MNAGTKLRYLERNKHFSISADFVGVLYKCYKRETMDKKEQQGTPAQGVLLFLKRLLKTPFKKSLLKIHINNDYDFRRKE